LKPVAPPATLPKTIVNALPTGAKIAQHIAAIEALLPSLQSELAAANKAGAIQLARAFVVMHRLNERMLSEEKAFKPFKNLWKETKELTVPACFEQSGVDNVPLSEGFRVGLSTRVVASIQPGQKEAAYKWLIANDYGDIIQETVNASTLSKLASELREKNKELPETEFKVADLNNTSVTKTA